MNLKKLSDAATQGEWGLFDDRGTLEIGHPEKLGERPCIVGWAGFDSTDKPQQERRANAKFIVALVNAYRAGELVVASARPEALRINPLVMALDSKEFYELCQAYRHAGHDPADQVETWAMLKEYILANSEFPQAQPTPGDRTCQVPYACWWPKCECPASVPSPRGTK